MRGVALVVALAIACSACHRSAQTTPAAQSSSVSSVASVSAQPLDAAIPSDASDESAKLCEGILAAQRKQVLDACAAKRADASATWGRLVDSEALAAVLSPDGAGVACVPFSGGAWALEIAELKFDERGGSLAGADLTMVLHRDGTRIAKNEVLKQPDLGGFKIALASDYDGDGVPELYVHTSSLGEEGGHSEEGRLYTSGGGVVKELAGSRALEEVGTPVDVDGDGRLDLPTSAGIHLEGDTSCGGKPDWQPARFVAHSLADGTFSTTDDVAKKAALVWCPTPPVEGSSPEEMLCARLWAKSPVAQASLRKATTCTTWDCAAEGADRDQKPSATKSCSALRKVLDSKLPFTLP